jgi:hypothetical protein
MRPAVDPKNRTIGPTRLPRRCRTPPGPHPRSTTRSPSLIPILANCASESGARSVICCFSPLLFMLVSPKQINVRLSHSSILPRAGRGELRARQRPIYGVRGPRLRRVSPGKSGPRNARRLAPATCPSRVDLHFRPADLLPSLQLSESASHAEWWQEVERLRSASTETTCGALARTFPGATAVGKYDNGTRRINEEIVGKLRPG